MDHGPQLLSYVFLFILSMSCFLSPLHLAAQQAVNITDPGEVTSLQLISEKLGFSQWNFNIDPCSWNYTSAPYIKCDCGGSSCHVTTLYLYNLNLAAEIPLEIMNFTHLTDLTMGLNLFSGSIPAQIGRLTSLKNIDFGINQLSGYVPSELGNLTNLTNLGFGSNQFVGAFPKELGNLTALTGLYLDGSGLSGELPTEFSKLTGLKTIWMFGNGFSGNIPDVFGGMVQLQELRMYGNNFSGPIPSSILTLKSLQKLSIGDLLDGGSIPTFSALQNLTYLSLRHNGLTGSIPNDIGSLVNLQVLDLSFNNLTGEIPVSFSSLKKLNKLFLGNNNLQGNISILGEIPALTNLDASNNQFSGFLPEWVNKSSLELNLLWNLFEQTDQNSRVNYATFNCLDTNSPCDRTASGTNIGFSINCGGPEITISGKKYSADTRSLGNSSYFQSTDANWGVSYVGYDTPDAVFPTLLSTTNDVRNTLYPNLYQTARGAANSLKYFGLSMINGVYNVELHFSEIAVTADNTWKSLGRRIFDVYIQNQVVLSDFNIRLEANGSFIALVKTFSATVTNNVLEIHFLWSGKGTCCSPNRWTYGPLVSAINVYANFSVDNPPASSSSTVGIIVGSVVGCGLAICLLLLIIWKKKCFKRDGTSVDLPRMETKPHMFTYSELSVATREFRDENKLGEGGFGSVFKGCLSNGQMIAVKRLSNSSEKRENEFLNEVAAISGVQHRNLVKLLGCCIQGDSRLLVFEYLEKNSLQHCLFDNKSLLDWSTRFNICIGIARGLAYLHEESRIRIVHRDIKASNILLDENLNPKIADFGLAKLFDDGKTHISTHVAGTIGYMAPEYVFQGRLTEKADVYSFGILLLEIVSGRPCCAMTLPNDKIYLLEWVWDLYEASKVVETVDEMLEGQFQEREVERVIKVGLLCTQAAPTARPRMSEVVSMLTGNTDLYIEISRPGYFTDLRQFTFEAGKPQGSSSPFTDTTNASTSGTTASDPRVSTSFIEPR